MKPELQAKIDAAKARQKAADAALLTKTAPKIPDYVDEIAGMKKTIGELEAANRSRPVAAPVTVETPTSKNVSFAKILLKTDRRPGGAALSVFEAKGWEDAPSELAVLRRGLMDKYAPSAKTWGEAEPIIKAMSFQDTASAGGLVPVALMTEIIPLNRSLDVIGALGVSMKTGLRGSVEWSRRISGTTFRPQAENPGADPTVDDLAYTKIQLQPRTFIGACKLSNQLLTQAGSVIEAEIRDDLGGAWVESRNSNLLVGSGVGGYPLGIANRTTGAGQSLMNTTSLAGALAVLFPLLWEMRALIRIDKNKVDGLKFAMNPADWNDLARAGAASTTSAPGGTVYPPLFNAGDPSKGVMPSLIGYPVIECDDLTVGTCILGDWSQAYWGEWSGVSLAMSDVAGDAFLQNQTYVRMIYDCDVAVAKPSAFCTGTGISL